MIRRTTWVILAIFVALLGLAWYMQRSDGTAQAETTPTAAPQPVFAFAESDVTGFKIEGDPDRVVALQRDANGAWALVEPAGQAADSDQADQGVRQVVALTPQTTLASPPEKNLIGLDPAVYTITLTLKDGAQHVVRVGNVTPIETGYYVQVDDGPVQVVSKFSLDSVVGFLENPPVLPTPTAAETGTPGATPDSEAAPSTPAATQQP